MLKRFKFTNYSARLTILCTLMAGVVASMVLVYVQSKQMPVRQPTAEPKTTEFTEVATEPQIARTEVVSGLSHPWEVAFLPNKTMLFTERSGTLSALVNGAKKPIITIPNVYTANEAGLTGLAIDTNFTNNNFIYTCFNASTNSGLDVRLVRWRLSDDLSGVSDRTDIVTNIPGNRNGYHSGCRVKSAQDGTIWVGTGDAYRAGVAQDPKSLGGKILHVTRDGMPASGNMPAPYDPRIFSYGHRNVQGIILFDQPTKSGFYGYSIEHGTTQDDEINLLKTGNFGWAPTVTYVENGVPMTDLAKFPDAVSAIWSSGNPTIAPSGGQLLNGKQWGTYSGAVAMAVLKGKELRIVKFKADNSLDFQKSVISDIGRVRTAVQGPDGNLYISTDNGANDKIIKLTPQR